MAARTIPDGAGVTNHFSVSFAPWVIEANATMLGSLKDETQVIDGPDGRGYSTGKASKQNVTMSIPAHDPATADMHLWKEACENGLPGHQAIGVVTISTAGDDPIEIWELENCLLHSVETGDMNLDGADVATNKWGISYARAKRIGP